MNNDLPDIIEDVVDEVTEKTDKPKVSIKRVWGTSKIVVFLSLIIVVLGLIIYINVINSRHNKELEEMYKKAFNEGRGQETIDITPEIKVNKATIMESLKLCAELTTIKYEYADIGDYTKDKKLFDKITIPFTTDKTIYAYKGVISIGIKDLDKSTIEVDEENKVIKVVLPKLEILSHELLNDKLKTYDIKKSMFTEMKLDNFNEFEKALKDAQEELILKDTDFWAKAKENTKVTVERLLSIYDLPEGYKIEIKIND